jgi:hypothetical protein
MGGGNLHTIFVGGAAVYEASASSIGRLVRTFMG